MKKNLKLVPFLFVIALLGFGAANSARAQMWQGVSVMNPGRWTLGAVSHVYFSPGEFMITGAATYGFTSRVQGEFRASFGTLDPQFGLNAKFAIAHSSFVNFGILAGFDYQNDFSLVGIPMIDHRFGAWNVYLGLHNRLTFASSALYGIGLLPGFSYGIAKGTVLYTEFNIGLSDQYDSGSVGARWWF